MPAFGGVRQRKKGKFTRRVGQVCVLGKSWMVLVSGTVTFSIKQCLLNLDCLLVKVLKGKYFVKESFLSTKLGHNPLLTWRSILWRRDLFAKGFRWRVGTGNDISIKDDPWIPNEGNFKPSWMADYVKDKRVSFMIDQDGRWNSSLIKEAFLP